MMQNDPGGDGHVQRNALIRHRHLHTAATSGNQMLRKSTVFVAEQHCDPWRIRRRSKRLGRRIENRGPRLVILTALATPVKLQPALISARLPGA